MRSSASVEWRDIDEGSWIHLQRVLRSSVKGWTMTCSEPSSWVGQVDQGQFAASVVELSTRGLLVLLRSPN